MSKEKQLYEILRTLQKGEIGTDLAHMQILRLFSVVGRSEQCVLHSTDWFGKCFKCGEQVFVRQEK
jgi:hypothetical protein